AWASLCAALSRATPSQLQIAQGPNILQPGSLPAPGGRVAEACVPASSTILRRTSLRHAVPRHAIAVPSTQSKPANVLVRDPSPAPTSSPTRSLLASRAKPQARGRACEPLCASPARQGRDRSLPLQRQPTGSAESPPSGHGPRPYRAKSGLSPTLSGLVPSRKTSRGAPHELPR